jgi:Protein of unknown function (DUF4240)
MHHTFTMDKSEFYALIDSAREESGPLDASADPDALRDVLNELDDDAIVEFGTEFTRELNRLNRWSIWGAGYVIAGGMSDDSFHYFRSWLIGKGSDAVEQALADPDGLGIYVDDDEVDNELLEYVAVELLEERGIQDDPRDAVDADTDGDPIGDPFDEDTVARDYPSLSNRDA